MAQKTQESKKVLRAKAKISVEQSVRRAKRNNLVEEVPNELRAGITCSRCKHHDNNPSYCKFHKKYVGRKESCRDFK